MISRGGSGLRQAGIGVEVSFSPVCNKHATGLGGDRVPFQKECFRGLSLKARADWRTFLRLPGYGVLMVLSLCLL